jgi:hypothetical protein
VAGLSHENHSALEGGWVTPHGGDMHTMQVGLRRKRFLFPGGLDEALLVLDLAATAINPALDVCDYRAGSKPTDESVVELAFPYQSQIAFRLAQTCVRPHPAVAGVN